MKRKDSQDRLSVCHLHFFHLIDQASQRLRIEPTLLILSGIIKCILLGVCISLLFFSV